MVSSSAVVPRSGLYYFSQGWKLITQPGIRRFVILPLLVNILLMGGAFWWLFTQLDSWIPALMSHVPDWLPVAQLLAVADCHYLRTTGVRLPVFHHSQLDCRAV